MMVIKVIMTDDEITTRINGTLEEIARYYFPNKNVVKIEILEGGGFKNDYYRQIPIEIYRTSKEDIAQYQLYNNIRYEFKLEYLQGQAKSHISSCGLCRI